MKKSYLLVLLAIFWGLHGDPAYSKEQSPDGKIRQFCGNSGSPTGSSFLHWDCEAIKGGSLQDLEASVMKSFSAPQFLAGSADKYYESEQPHYAVWIFVGIGRERRAARYRAMFDGENYKGVGVTTWCADTKLACEKHERDMAREIPKPFVFKLGPPPPTPPQIVD